MRVYQLTSIGNAIASNPSHEPSVALSILYWLRRHQGRGSDEQIEQFVEGSRFDKQKALNSLVRAKAIIQVA